MTTLYEFSSKWCKPCKLMKPLVDSVVFKMNIDVVEVDVESQPDVAQKYHVMSLPTIILFENDKPVASHVGSMTVAELENFVSRK